jgi:hypothetical protein
MMRIPGVRDRVVRIFLEEDEGGVNIKMPKKGIESLTTKYGKPAAKEFIKKFAVDGSPGWPEHRWVRFNVVLTGLRKRIEGVTSAMRWIATRSPLDKPSRTLSRRPPLRGSRGAPAPSEKPLCAEQATELERLLAVLAELEKHFKQRRRPPPLDALPRPIMRVRHPT